MESTCQYHRDRASHGDAYDMKPCNTALRLNIHIHQHEHAHHRVNHEMSDQTRVATYSYCTPQEARKSTELNGCQQRDIESETTLRMVPLLIKVNVASALSLTRENVLRLRGNTATAWVGLSKVQQGQSLATESSHLKALIYCACCVQVISDLFASTELLLKPNLAIGLSTLTSR